MDFGSQNFSEGRRGESVNEEVDTGVEGHETVRNGGCAQSPQAYHVAIFFH